MYIGTTILDMIIHHRFELLIPFIDHTIDRAWAELRKLELGHPIDGHPNSSKTHYQLVKVDVPFASVNFRPQFAIHKLEEQDTAMFSMIDRW